MWRRLAPLALFVALAGTAAAQPPAPRPPAAGTGAAAAPTTPDAPRPALPLVWAVAILGTLVILTIVCMPSRKG